MTLTGTATEENLTGFIEVYRLPSIIEFNGDTAPKVFERKLRKHVILFIEKDADYFETKLEEYRKAAVDFRGKVT